MVDHKKSINKFERIETIQNCEKHDNKGILIYSMKAETKRPQLGTWKWCKAPAGLIHENTPGNSS